MRALPVLVLALGLAPAHAAPLPGPARAEVAALLDRLHTSGCQFNRNGTWHSGAQAKAHLQRKLEHLEKKGLVRTAEQFIELGAAASSTSGTPYLVRCGAAAAVESKTWLGTELKAIRAR